MTVTCPHCRGYGQILMEGVTAGCCGNVWPDGACKGECAVPMQAQEIQPCEICGGSGHVEET